LSTLACVFVFFASLLAAPREAQWEKVEAARDQKLPKSAIAALEPIIAGALADKAYAEAIKAIGQKIALEREIEGNKPEEQVTRILAELDRAPAEMKPALEAILAHWYWHYFQQNRGRFLNRTQTAGAPGPDFQTWDLARILAEIDRRFTAALANEELLQKTPVTAYDLLIERGTVPDTYRPTLFDFLAHEALMFYQAGEQGAVNAEDSFELTADSPIFADATEFIRWRAESTDDQSSIRKAVRLYQKLLEFHRDDADRTAYYDADLARLTYAYNTAVGEEKEERYEAALERFIKATAKHEISARALAELATRLHHEGDPTRAHELARRGLNAFPKSMGAALCYNLLQQIEARQADLQTEHVWNAPWPTLDITYRNVTRVHFRAVAVDFEEYLAKVQWNYGRVDHNLAQLVQARTPVLEWQAELPPTKDFRVRTESLPAPTTLRPGFYFILSSHNPSFAAEDNQVSIVPFWVSDLALVTRDGTGEKASGGFVLQAGSGEPVAGATVRLWQRQNDGRFKAGDRTQTDADGRFQFSQRETSRGVVLLAEHSGQAVASLHELSLWRRPAADQGVSQTVFFTDRALYRPGQTISYKGISIRRDAGGATYETLARKKIEVTFLDGNGKEIARATHRTNDYGSFSGTFTAPRDRSLGHMSLRAERDAPGYASFRVEEYKRPKFQVELKAPAEAARLDATARLAGKATAYTGAAIGGAKVKWRVERNVQFPPWCWWWQPPARKAIAHGTAITAADGTFSVEFTTTPDRSVPVKTEPVFWYVIHADVTDSTGETRSADQGIRVGYTALQATLATDEWQVADKAVEFAIDTRSLDGIPQAAEGTLTIHALKQPAAVARARLPAALSYRFRDQRRPSAEPENDPANPETWESG
ncbi:MAG TPA: MG2 domain-containing protein, partial [Lacunisphaera sp.]|nr:MG2 domain-containing protein [Lacunisphaera sp.]